MSQQSKLVEELGIKPLYGQVNLIVDVVCEEKFLIKPPELVSFTERAVGISSQSLEFIFLSRFHHIVIDLHQVGPCCGSESPTHNLNLPSGFVNIQTAL